MNKTFSLRLIGAAVAGTLAITGLSACQGKNEFPKQPAKAKVSVHPAISADRAAAVVSEINAKISAADQAKDLNAAGGRIDGPAKQMRQAQYELFGKDQKRSVLGFANKSKALAVTASVQWPRAILNVTDVPADKPGFVQILRQNTNQDAFKLWQWMQILPGKEIPPTSVAAKGSQIIAPDSSEGLITSPIEAAKLWESNALGAQKNPVKLLEDQMSNTLRDENAKLQENLKDLGKLEYSVKLEDEQPLALRLPSGGALVAATYRYALDLKDLKLSSPVELSGEVAALLGHKGKVREHAHWEYLITVLLQIPAKDGETTGKEKDTAAENEEKTADQKANQKTDQTAKKDLVDGVNPVAATRVLVSADGR